MLAALAPPAVKDSLNTILQQNFQRKWIDKTANPVKSLFTPSSFKKVTRRQLSDDAVTGCGSAD